MRIKLYGLTNDILFYQSRIVKGNYSLKEPRAYSIATSPGSPAEVDVFRALSESSEKCDWCLVIMK